MLISILFFFIIITAGCVEVDDSAFSKVRHEEGKTYIIDRTGYKWDVTQAATLGFKPAEPS